MDTVRLPEMGCSGFLIRNTTTTGEPIGVQTAQHCGGVSQGETSNWLAGANGEPIIPYDAAVDVETGDVFGNMTDIGDIGQFALSSPEDRTRDLALGALEDQSIREVSADYPQMSPEEVAALKPGDVIYNSGWPADQVNNPGPRKRQAFAMSVLGTTTVTTTKGDTLNVLIAAVPESADGAECSFGDSGSAGFTVDSDGRPRIIGPLSTFDDFGLVLNHDNPTEAASARLWYENEFGVDLSGYAAVCGFAIGPLSPSTEVTPQVSAPEDPNFDPLTILERRYEADFFNPDFTRQVINGLVVIDGLKNSQYIDRPAVYYDPAQDVTLLAWYDPSAPDNLDIQAFYGSDSLRSIAIYSDNDGQIAPDLISSTGAVTPNEDTWPGSPGFTDTSGLHFGEQHFINPLKNDPATDLSQSTLSVVNGQLSVDLVPNVYHNQEVDDAAATAAFNDPGSIKEIVNGGVTLPIGSESLGTPVDRPYLYLPGDGSAVVGYSTTKDSGQLDTYFYPSLSDPKFYQDAENDPVTVKPVSGPVSFQGDPSGQTDGEYVDATGFGFGKLLTSTPLKPGPTYEVVVGKDGSLRMQPTS